MYSKQEQKAFREILGLVDKGEIDSEKELDNVKRRLTKRYKLTKMPTNADIMTILPEEDRQRYTALLQTKGVRSISGTTIIAVASYPFQCVANCVYCPAFPGKPRSYTGTEPAMQRGEKMKYDPFLQITNRLGQLKVTNHPTDKIEIIVLGGTFLGYDTNYKTNYIKGIYEALNGKRIDDFNEAKNANETAPHRAVSLTIETRPDYCFEPHIDEMLDYGTTRVEVGVQVLDDEIFEKVKRGHTVADVVKATRLLKENCFKFVYHWMPGLFADYKKDVEMFKRLFEDPAFRPDMIKIYPTLVAPNSQLFNMWKKGEYKALTNEESVELIAEMKKYVPRYCRIQRVQRDFAVQNIFAGPTAGNLRELVHRRMKEKGDVCQCIRCREIGHRIYKEHIDVDMKSIKMNVLEYEASEGTEAFISFDETKTDSIIGFIRLRINNNKAHRPEITKKTALIRELRVYGSQVAIGEFSEEDWQHKKFGERLLKAAEDYAVEKWKAKDMIINSAVGVRGYYRKFGYGLKGPYMWKKL